MENEIKQENLEAKSEGGTLMDTLKTQVDELSLKLKDVTELQSKMVDVIKKTNEMQITTPNIGVEVLSDSEKFVLDTIDEYKANPNTKWMYPRDSKKFDVVVQYVLEQKDYKEIAKRYE